MKDRETGFGGTDPSGVHLGERNEHDHGVCTSAVGGPQNDAAAVSGIGPLISGTGTRPVHNSNVFDLHDRDGRLCPPDDFEHRSCVAVDETGGVSLVVLELQPGDPTPTSIWSSGGGVWSTTHYLSEWSEFTALSRRCAAALAAAGIQWTPVTALALAGLAYQQATDWPQPEEAFNIDRFHAAVKQVAPFCMEQPHDRTWSYNDAGDRVYEEISLGAAPGSSDSSTSDR